MKKTTASLKFGFKILLLLVLLGVGWAYLNVTNMFKGKKVSKDTALSTLFGMENTNAEDPKATTPFLSYFDGKEYVIENDILFGRPNSFHKKYEVGKALYEDGRIFPDMYKITAPIKPHDGKLLFQIQEIEPEESFFKWIELDRVVHPKNTKVVVNSDFKKFYVLDKNKLENSVSLPVSAIDARGNNRKADISDVQSLWQTDPVSSMNMFFEANEGIEVIFKDLRKGEMPYLLTKTWFRDWVPGEEDGWQENIQTSFSHWMHSPIVAKSLLALPIVVAAWFFEQREAGVMGGMMSFFMGNCPCSDPCLCLMYAYKDESGQYQWMNISGVRSWKYNNELIEFPREAVNKKGELTLRVAATQKHTLGFVGVVQEDDVRAMSIRNYTSEKLELKKAYHSRTQNDVRGALQKGNWKEYLHTIPGDKVDLEFEAPNTKLNTDEEETYLFRSSGFYTSLRKENARLAGDWEKIISPEAQSRLASLVPQKKYK